MLVNGSDPVKARYVEIRRRRAARRRQPDAVDDAHQGRRELRDEARQGRRVHVRRRSRSTSSGCRRAAADRRRRCGRCRPTRAEARGWRPCPSSRASRSTTSTARPRGSSRPVSQPLVVKTTRVDGRDTPLETFADRGRRDRLADVRRADARRRRCSRSSATRTRSRGSCAGSSGPRSSSGPSSLLAGGLGAVVAFVLLGIVSFFVELDWGAARRWVLALALGGAGVRGARRRDRRARARGASRVAARLRARAAAGLPRARPAGAVSAGLYDVIRSSRPRSRSSRRSTRSQDGARRRSLDGPGPAPRRARPLVVRRSPRVSACGACGA